MDYRSRYRFWLPLVVRYVTRLFFSFSLLSWIQYAECDLWSSLDISLLPNCITSNTLRPSLRQTLVATYDRTNTTPPLHNPLILHTISLEPQDRKRKRKEREEPRKLTTIFPTNRLPRPRRPPPRSLLRQARGPACCCHGSGLKLSSFPSISIPLERRGRKTTCTAKALECKRKANERCF